MEKVFVTDLQDKQSVQTTFLAKNKLLLTDKKGKNYMSLKLSDSTGDIDARAWDNVDRFEGTFQSGDIVQVKGVVQLYQNKKQLVVHKVELYDGSVDLTDYLRSSDTAPEEMLQSLLQIVEKIESQHIKQLITSVLSDPTIKPLLLLAPAAKSIHHARIGGLLEHILSISRLAEGIASHYSFLNLDLLIFGAIFHDIGKIWELETTDKGVRYTTKGRLIGHMVMAVELVEKKASQIFGFPEELKDMCKHIILGHHGKLEYGSPKLPQTMEAYVVWLLDEMDSKIDSIESIYKAHDGNDDWSAFSQLFERHFYLKRDRWD